MTLREGMDLRATRDWLVMPRTSAATTSTPEFPAPLEPAGLGSLVRLFAVPTGSERNLLTPRVLPLSGSPAVPQGRAQHSISLDQSRAPRAFLHTLGFYTSEVPHLRLSVVDTDVRLGMQFLGLNGHHFLHSGRSSRKANKLTSSLNRCLIASRAAC